MLPGAELFSWRCVKAPGHAAPAFKVVCGLPDYICRTAGLLLPHRLLGYHAVLRLVRHLRGKCCRGVAGGPCLNAVALANGMLCWVFLTCPPSALACHTAGVPGKW